MKTALRPPAAVFVVPVRHHESVSDWPSTKALIRETLVSIASQTSPDWGCVVVANRGSDLPTLPSRCHARFVDLPKPVLPDMRTDIQGYYDAIRADKGRRVLEGLRDIDDESFAMTVDFDDFVSREIVAYARRNRSVAGWYIKKGYMFGGSGWVAKERRLYERCGSSHIIRRGLLGRFEYGEGMLDIPAIKRRLGSHRFIQEDLAAEGHPLAPLPFPGTIYRVGHVQSSSGPRSFLHDRISPQAFRRHPLRALEYLTRCRPLTASLRARFGMS